MDANAIPFDVPAPAPGGSVFPNVDLAGFLKPLAGQYPVGPAAAAPAAPVGVPAPANATSADVAAAPVPKAVPVPPGFANPHPTNTLAEHMTRNMGTPMTTIQSREHDPAYMTLEDAIHANRHLTPMDIQMMTPLLPPQLSPHDQMVGTMQEIASGERKAALTGAKSAQDIINANNAYWDRAKAIVAPPLNPDALTNILGPLIRAKGAGMK